MKRHLKWTTLLLTALLFFTLTDSEALASDKTLTAEEAMEQLRKEDNGPDLSLGELISEEWNISDDGIPYVKRSYAKYNMSLSRATLPGVTLTNVWSAGARGSVDISAIFTYNTSRKQVWVISMEGHVTTTGGVSSVSDEQTYSSGNYTEKATATYSCKVDKHLGGTSTWKVSVSCDYNGKKC